MVATEPLARSDAGVLSVSSRRLPVPERLTAPIQAQAHGGSLVDSPTRLGTTLLGGTGRAHHPPSADHCVTSRTPRGPTESGPSHRQIRTAPPRSRSYDTPPRPREVTSTTRMTICGETSKTSCCHPGTWIRISCSTAGRPSTIIRIPVQPDSRRGGDTRTRYGTGLAKTTRAQNHRATSPLSPLREHASAGSANPGRILAAWNAAVGMAHRRIHQPHTGCTGSCAQPCGDLVTPVVRPTHDTTAESAPRWRSRRRAP